MSSLIGAQEHSKGDASQSAGFVRSGDGNALAKQGISRPHVVIMEVPDGSDDARAALHESTLDTEHPASSCCALRYSLGSWQDVLW